jgi:hypothetical protein
MTPRKLNNTLLSFQIYFSIPLSFSVVRREAEEWWNIVWEDVGCAGATAHFIAPWCNNQGGKAVGLHRRGKKEQ